MTITTDTLDVFVVHYPSKSSGAKESEPYRLHVANKLRTSPYIPSHTNKSLFLIKSGIVNKNLVSVIKLILIPFLLSPQTISEV